MKYIATKLDQMAAINGEAELVPAPDQSGLLCLKIGDRYILPFVGWMSYDAASENWIEIDEEDEETLMNTLTENYAVQEISDKEAGEKFSNDIEFIE